MEQRERIVEEILSLAEEIAQRSKATGVIIESYADQFLPDTKYEPIQANLVDALETWAYTYLDYLSGGIEDNELNSDDIKHQLMNLELEKYLNEKLELV